MRAWRRFLGTLVVGAIPALITAGWFLALGCASYPPPPTVNRVDLPRYAGKWYEIARYPAFFQRGCSNTTAVYTPRPDGRIAVLNSCTKEGRPKSISGVASAVPESGGAKLKVDFGFLLRGDYWILALDKNYRWAIVGHPSRKYLWILAREPEISPELFERLRKRVSTLGYDPGRMLITDQSGNIPRKR